MKSLDDIAGQLRQAGAPFDIQTYRRSNLFWVLVVPVFLAIPGIILRSTILAVVLFLAGALLGSRRMGAHLRSLRRKRAARLRSDLPTVAVMVAAKTANTKSLVVAVREIAQAGSGPVIQDLKRALGLIDGGYGARAAFELIGLEAVDPAATRIYRLLATATTGSIDLPGSLIELASELRAQRREEVERTASKRQLAMNGPIVFVTMPVLFMFIIVPTVSFLHA
jgi:tight adherence protein C